MSYNVPFAGACHSGFGLLNVYGTPKPEYRAFQLLHEAGNKRLQVTSSNKAACTDGGVLASSNGTFVNLFLYNHQISGDPGQTCNLIVAVTGLPTNLTLEYTNVAMATRIDKTHSNPKALFVQMGSPDNPTEEQLQELEVASELIWGQLGQMPGIHVGYLHEGPSAPVLSISVEVPAHAICVVRIPLQLQ